MLQEEKVLGGISILLLRRLDELLLRQRVTSRKDVGKVHNLQEGLHTRALGYLLLSHATSNLESVPLNISSCLRCGRLKDVFDSSHSLHGPPFPFGRDVSSSLTARHPRPRLETNADDGRRATMSGVCATRGSHASDRWLKRATCTSRDDSAPCIG